MHPRRFSRRSLMAAGFGVTVGAAAASLLAACGEDEAESETMTETTTSDGGQRETVTIEYLNWAFSELGEAPAAQILDAFHAAMPHIQVEPQNLGFSQAQDKMITLHAAGALPDAIQIGFWQIGDFWDQGMIREVETMANAASFDWSEYAEPLKNRIGNEIVVVPMSTIAGLTHYNEGTFEAAGVDGPRITGTSTSRLARRSPIRTQVSTAFRTPGASKIRRSTATCTADLAGGRRG